MGINLAHWEFLARTAAAMPQLWKRPNLHRSVGANQRQENLWLLASVREDSARHRIQRVYGEKPGHAAHAGMEGAEMPRLSRWREAHHQRVETSSRYPGVSTDFEPKHSQGIDAAHEPNHNAAVRSQRYRPYETSVAKPRSKSWRQLWRQIPRAKISKKRMLTVSKPANVRNVRRKHGGRSRSRTYDLAHVRRAL